VKKTFTLIEVIIVASIIAIIITVAAVNLQGCSGGVETGASTKKEMEQTEANHEKLVIAVPPPRLATSQERINLKKRLERFNSESKVSYIYLIDYGRIMGFFTVKGKVSSVNSLLTTPDQIVTMTSGSIVSERRFSRHVVASPDLDGSYGSNGNAIFFFTTDDTYVEWSGTFMLCDRPLKLSSPPLIVINEGAEAEVR